MVASVDTVAYLGLEARGVECQVQLSAGLPAFVIVGLPDKAVAESRERVRSALSAIGLSLPPKRVTVNLSPADLPKEGSHFDLPIALGLLAAMGVIDAEMLSHYVVVGELGLDGRVTASPGVLLAAMHAVGEDKGLICPSAQGPEAAWAGDVEVLAAPDLLALMAHFKGDSLITPPEPGAPEELGGGPDLKQVKGQETPKRALEIAAAGAHNLLMSGPPGSGKSMLAASLPSILPPLSPSEALEVSMIASVAGTLEGGKLKRRRPFRDPHHSASMPALVGGGLKVKPGEISLAHLGVLFLDELPEFQRGVLDSLRQPLETGTVSVARANAHLTFPARVQLIAAMNPCRCGHLGDPALACARAPRCAADYQAKISGPLLDRIDLHVEVAAVSAADLTLPPPAEGSAEVAQRVAAARNMQARRYEGQGARTNAEASPELIEAAAKPDEAGAKLLADAASAMRLSARAYHRVLRVARTIGDLAGAEQVGRIQIAEALSYRHQAPRN
ncbi:YifB family Mg chelatase-like AAA ATPase [Sphingomicrobium sediminis]|uniref:YifB family Mg chelatase-like AAA ATPase n=1 Tax=Sphingomicrobium sediminis TaxID=2950949 RepID=A0A9X2EFL5_9SPHN|nr:YifB family Mg chelatase-like AAA ATPase [Sphingomicrobium sediminis]MCM8557058.1 YifB family Mg chelatase-like AAA ATPase [Sphingomicrobium sediminis]